ncbi:hypothetical protein CBM2605_A60337 [Cupriavidus neocaledonicus]|uniref:Uncharacterized protein n=1 Tax=Cupriavidus neocaledonicus TaxID=1040979 RepID=A0ABY1V3M5_9BURK|nr:hypothetical protein CBM2605_A60337 [Cupriavidus neocaledonicus]
MLADTEPPRRRERSRRRPRLGGEIKIEPVRCAAPPSPWQPPPAVRVGTLSRARAERSQRAQGPQSVSRQVTALPSF